MVSEPGKLLKRYASLFDIQALQAVVQVAIEVAEEYLPGGEELSEALKNLFFERAKEVSIQEQEEKDEVMAAAEVRRSNQLIYLPWEPSLVIQMPGMTGRRTSWG